MINKFDKLADAHSRFFTKCLLKLAVKAGAGFQGWDDPSNYQSLIEGMNCHLNKKWDKSNLIDIANFCMFLWNLAEQEKTNG